MFCLTGESELYPEGRRVLFKCFIIIFLSQGNGIIRFTYLDYHCGCSTKNRLEGWQDEMQDNLLKGA